MGSYIQIDFNDISGEQSDVLVALLNNIGFEGFEEEDRKLKAYIPKGSFNESALNNCIAPIGVVYLISEIGETNWNKVWESNFGPVVVDDFVAVRSDFHAPEKNVEIEIIITPKMSFGTGHHATTYMMIQQMRTLDFLDKVVLDFGTGTGVLSILAEKTGAKQVVAIDNDKWSIDNAGENIRRNNCTAIEVLQREGAAVDGKFDIILANINKNIILDNLETLKERLLPGGIMCLSGLLKEDEQEILSKCNKIGLKFDNKADKHNWLFVSVSHLLP